jgi:hypothetical protein
MATALTLGHKSYLYKVALALLNPILKSEACRLALQFDIQEERQIMSLNRMKSFEDSCRRKLERMTRDVDRMTMGVDTLRFQVNG